MRIKTYIATTNSEAIELVRKGLGNNAIIISSGKTEDGNSVRIVAAVDLTSTSEIEKKIEEEYEHVSDLNVEETVRQALIFHGAPPQLTARISIAAAKTNAQSPTLALAAAFDVLFEFSVLSKDIFESPIMLVGPPGSGETTVAAKFCALAKLTNCQVQAILCDIQRAGGVEQFKALTSILGVDLVTAPKAADLKSHIKLGAPAQMQVIDTAATNPFNEMEMANLSLRIKAAKAEPILVFSAVSNPHEVADIAWLYRKIGIKKFITTQVDISQRVGSILAAADSASLTLLCISDGARVADGLKPIDPKSLARLILPHTDNNTSNQKNTEATQ